MQLLVVSNGAAAQAESPFATTVVNYVAGIGAASGFTNPLVALGSPERFTGDGLIPQAVTPFQPPFMTNEIVSIGMGGSLTLAFDHDVVDDPDNPFGIDLLVFSNAFATDAFSPQGVMGSMFGEGGAISVSLDGSSWTPVPGIAADGPLPTMGYVDVGPYATRPGLVETDFTKPVNPAHTPASLAGLSYELLVAAYDGAGGGVGIDLKTLGLSAIRYVRIDGNLSFGITPEIDAIADVAPASRAVPFDLTNDGLVDAADLGVLLGAWATSGPGDFDGNGVVDAADLGLLLGAWS
ncbi:MAG: hypothetical protein JNM94_02970 [Phycisphaerae bacterium]|nr:hypothetical protein [Phycisphaerae bacterium]